MRCMKNHCWQNGGKEQISTVVIGCFSFSLFILTDKFYFMATGRHNTKHIVYTVTFKNETF